MAHIDHQYATATNITSLFGPQISWIESLAVRNCILVCFRPQNYMRAWLHFLIVKHLSLNLSLKRTILDYICHKRSLSYKNSFSKRCTYHCCFWKIYLCVTIVLSSLIYIIITVLSNSHYKKLLDINSYFSYNCPQFLLLYHNSSVLISCQSVFKISLFTIEKVSVS